MRDHPQAPKSTPPALQDLQEFRSKYWEKAPVVIKATPERKAFFSNVMGMHELLEVAKQRDQDEEQGPLMFPLDLNAVKYDGTKRTGHNGEVRLHTVIAA